jgi:hypothetical protein
MFVKVTGTNFIRDTGSMALSNTNEAEKNEYLTKAKLLSNQKNEINKVKSEIDDIKSDVSEIKQMLLKLMDKNQNG